MVGDPSSVYPSQLLLIWRSEVPAPDAREEELLKEALEALKDSPIFPNHWREGVMMRSSSQSLLLLQMISQWFFKTIRFPSFRATHEALSSSRRHSVYILFSTRTASKQTFYSAPIEPIKAAAASTRAINLREFHLVHKEHAYTDHYRAQSARGLILFSRSFKWNLYQDDVLLFYPATKKSVVIPPTHPRHAAYSNISSTTYSLGYSRQSDIYKVLAFNWKGNNACTVNILTVKESDRWAVNGRNWRELVENLPLVLQSQVCVQDTICVQHKGSIHWLNHSAKLILSFDVEKEIFSTTPAPVPTGESCGSLLNLGGRLARVGFTTETVLWTSDDDLAKAWKQETIQMESDDSVIDPLSNPIDDRFLIWPSPNASAMEILQIYFYNRANKTTRSQNLQVDSGEWDEPRFFSPYEDILLLNF